jgi:hypothetical protein
MDDREGQESSKRFFLIAWAIKFHQYNMNAIDNGNQLKDIGLKMMYLAMFAVAFEVLYNSYFLDHSKGIIENINQYFINISPGITILAAGFACYAFGVTLVENQKRESKK